MEKIIQKYARNIFYGVAGPGMTKTMQDISKDEKVSIKLADNFFITEMQTQFIDIQVKFIFDCHYLTLDYFRAREGYPIAAYLHDGVNEELIYLNMSNLVDACNKIVNG